MIRGPASIEQKYQHVLAGQPEILADDSVRCHSLDDALVAELPNWPASPRFSSAQRACLAFTEQYVVDVASIDDALVTDLSDAVGHDAVTNFVSALLVVEQRLRLSLAWGRLLPEVVS
jgi:hypothetical protein